MADDDLFRLAADLGAAGRDALPFAATALGKTSNRIKQAWRGKVQGSLGLEGLAYALSYDVTVHAADVSSEIGYDKGKAQGPLGNISEFGSIRHPPRGFGAAALQENTADFEHGIDRAVGDALKAHNL